MVRRIKFYALLVLCFILYSTTFITGNLIISGDASAQGIALSPSRIIFDDRKRKDRVIVSNPGDTPRSYRVHLLKRRMTETGKYEDVKEGEEKPDEKFANGLVRFSPRSFTVEPKSSQTVRLRLRKPKDLEDGEYRSHLRVQVLPETSTPTIRRGGGVGISIRVNYGITIPIIVRKGTLDYTVKVRKLALNRDQKTGRTFLEAHLSREGNRSSYGDISVIFRDSSGKEHLLKFLPGLSLFYPNKTRTFTIPLDIPEGVKLSQGILKVVYREQEAEGGAIIAEGSKSL
jgi:hypothetical protein